MKRALFTFVFFLISVAYTLAQCPMCKTAVESNLKNDGATAGLGLNDGILYLLAAPYLLFGTVIFFWIRNKRRSQAA
ncbi:MAG: hypothetical protein LPK49_08660 [Bacteroidota bacterium]|nr:hypothetical protein [Bacteroidota bacterium]MDX5431099.1 hypothetical protein [Bacteroidota bacterium]